MYKTRVDATEQALFHPETGSVLHALGEITATLRYYQAFGDPQDLDEGICSLIALEARLQQFMQKAQKLQQKH